MVETDICIVGAGPVGLFAVFEAGLLKMRCHLVDTLPQVGGQLSEIYPKKPIYDIPGYPEIKAEELVRKLQEQIEPFKPTFTLGDRVEALTKDDKGFVLTTSQGTEIQSKVIVIAGGLGCFEPRKPDLDQLGYFEGNGVDYMVRDPEKFRNKKLLIAGGGDSALDWTIYLADVAKHVTLVHRNESFRGSPDSAEKVSGLAKAGKINVLMGTDLLKLHGNGALKSVSVSNKDGLIKEIETDHMILLFGLSPKLGPVGTW
jgi:thioredoxin reductase (NADPH)